MIIFVSGPYSHPDDMRVLNNVENAMWVGYELTRRGHWPVVPHLMHYFDMFLRRERIAHPPYDFYIQWCLSLLDRCDALYLIDRSPGADQEVRRANRNNIPIYRRMNQVPDGRL
jgi:hypothetical protein